jgi:hypothetical protein
VESVQKIKTANLMPHIGHIHKKLEKLRVMAPPWQKRAYDREPNSLRHLSLELLDLTAFLSSKAEEGDAFLWAVQRVACYFVERQLFRAKLESWKKKI